MTRRNLDVTSLFNCLTQPSKRRCLRVPNRRRQRTSRTHDLHFSHAVRGAAFTPVQREWFVRYSRRGWPCPVPALKRPEGRAPFRRTAAVSKTRRSASECRNSPGHSTHVFVRTRCDWCSRTQSRSGARRSRRFSVSGSFVFEERRAFLSSQKAAVERAALQTLRVVRGPMTSRQRLECGCFSTAL
jgi:hypothetical protein